MVIFNISKQATIRLNFAVMRISISRANIASEPIDMNLKEDNDLEIVELVGWNSKRRRNHL